MDIILKYFIYGILLLMLRECRAIKINRMSVPSRYELKNDNHRLILDCDYSVSEDEKGFVLKWHRDGVVIYQWIASRLPYALGAYKDRIDLKYQSDPDNSENRLKKFSALAILNPTTSDTGNYTCNVQSFTSSDKRTEEMIIIDPADSVKLTYKIDQENLVVNFECSVINIFPLPDVKFLFSNGHDFHTENETMISDSRYNITLRTEIPKDDIDDESEVTCLVQIPNTEYEAKDTVTYDDPKQTPSDKKSMSGEYRSQSDTAGDENFAHRIASSVNLLIIVMIAVTLGR